MELLISGREIFFCIFWEAIYELGGLKARQGYDLINFKTIFTYQKVIYLYPAVLCLLVFSSYMPLLTCNANHSWANLTMFSINSTRKTTSRTNWQWCLEVGYYEGGGPELGQDGQPLSGRPVAFQVISYKRLKYKILSLKSVSWCRSALDGWISRQTMKELGLKEVIDTFPLKLVKFLVWSGGRRESVVCAKKIVVLNSGLDSWAATGCGSHPAGSLLLCCVQ
jgi:hypothetical protein